MHTRKRAALITTAVLIMSAASYLPQAAADSPRITWTPRRSPLTATAGAVTSQMLVFSSTQAFKELKYEVDKPLQGLVSADPAGIRALGGDQFGLPITLTPGADAKGEVKGHFELLDGRQKIHPRLTLTVQIVVPSAKTVPATASAPSPDRIVSESPKQLVVKDELAVALSFDLPDPEARIREIAAAQGAVIQGAVPDSRLYQLRFPGVTLTDLKAKATTIGTLPGVESASLNLVDPDPGAVDPDDTQWDRPWDTAHPGGNNWAMETIDAPGAWDTTTGSSSLKIGVVDADFDRDHGDLDDNITRFDGRGTTAANGHGTHVAGTICAEGNNGKGVSGMMWDCSLRLYPYGSDTVTTAEAMTNAVKDGDRAVNMSLQFVENNACGTPGTAHSLTLVRDANAVLARPILYAKRTDRDVLWVFAAGNECREAKYASPGSLVNEFPENTMAIAAVDRAGNLSAFSNFGPLITVAAPGSDILSTVPRTCTFWVFCTDQYGTKSGTSMAAPHVTGLAGLVMSKHPTKSATQVKQCIVKAAVDSGAAIPGRTFKVINAKSAVSCSATLDLPPKVDVVLSLDLTGSMGGVLSLVKTQVTQAISDLKAASPGTDFHFGVTSYEDYPGFFDSRPCGSSYVTSYGSGGDSPFRITSPLTTNAAAIATDVNALSLGNGDDGPEAYARALWEVGQADTGAALGFRPDALKLLVNFGDNLPHDRDINAGVADPPFTFSDLGIDPGRNGTIDCGGDDIDFQDGALAALRAAKVRLLEVNSSGSTSIEPYWRLWASRTGGSYTSLTPSDSRTLSQVIIDLLRTAPDAPVD